MTSNGVRVGELIERIKTELITTASSEPFLFAIGNVEIEITFTVERDVNGGIDLQVVKAGVDKKTSELQTIRLTLEPLATPEEVRRRLTSKQLDHAATYSVRTFEPDNDQEERSL